MTEVDRIVASGFDAIESQVAIIDIDGVIVYTNDAWKEFGRENGLEGEPIGPGDDYLAVCGSDDEPELDTESETDPIRACNGLESVLDGDADRFSFEYPCHSPDAKRWFMMRCTPFAVDGERYAVVMHVDITDRKLAEIDAREHTEQLEMVARVLSHDLRNPLNVAMGRLETGDSEIVEQQLERMHDIIENALVFTRGPGTAEPKTLDLEAVARNAWETVETQDAILAFDSTTGVQADPRLLPHLFENLFRNSIEHAGPDVQVTVGTMETGFYVADDGPGLQSSARIEPDEGDKGASGGEIGLGLAIVTAVADAHGWRIETPPDADGARFEFHTE